MSLLAEVAAVLRQVVDWADSARVLLRTAADLLEETTTDLATALLGSSNEAASQLLGTFAHCHRLAESLLDRLGAAEEHLDSYLENLLGDGDGVPLWRLPVGRLHGEDAHGHTNREGVGIGRPARGSKKEPVREVRTTEELVAVFRALVRGGRRVHKPSYRGLLCRLPTARRSASGSSPRAPRNRPST
ncbi:hypothetical protein KCV87_17400 [Actinosynnema pretiosum subsp. pretiosum]|uniref:Uncharacterized protein n=1 Tax=Actinosynnema pretiosum subsp. pretiosum TaxID=103721 RepID=A0AA45LC71_9PSEU|nr:hypothetical protein KCV87_17400 [Actinosynnema pretiosum subsp. pretiosum]